MGRRRDRRRARRAKRKENRAIRKAEREAALAGRSGWDRLSANIGYRSKNFTKNQKEIVKDRAQNTKELRVFDAIDSVIESRIRPFSVKYWKANNGRLPVYPEMQLPEVASKPNIGVCFSGGGNRSAVASFGIMRGLRALGLDQKIRYTSANSGGSWFTIPYSFLPAKFSDNHFFGQYLTANNMSGPPIALASRLTTNCNSSLFCKVAADNPLWNRIVVGGLLDEMLDIIKPANGSADEAWSRAVGYYYLKDFDLFEAQRINSSHSFFTWSAKTKSDALEANKFLDDLDFFTVEKSRPYPIAIGTILAQPAGAQVLQNGVNSSPTLRGVAQLEMTPIYTGITTSHSGLGGGVIESFGIDRAFKKYENGTYLKAKAGQAKHKRFTIGDMMGISGSALGLIDLSVSYTPGVGINIFTPNIKHWSFASPTNAPNLNAIDGGYLENLGIMPLLRRGVKKILICNNDGRSFSSEGKMPGVISHLFGVAEGFYDTHYSELIGRHKNHVFSNQNGEYERLSSQLLNNLNSRGVSFHRDIYNVVKNDNYGVHPYQVEIFWINLDKSQRWTNIADTLSNAFVDERPYKKLKKSLTRFPNFNTARLNLSEVEVALLANHTDWNIRQIADELTDFFG